MPVKALQWCLSQQMTAISRTVTVLETQWGGGGGQEEEKKIERKEKEMVF